MILGETRDRERCAAWVNYALENPDTNIDLYLAAGTLPFSREKPLKQKMLDDISAMLYRNGYKRVEYTRFHKGGQPGDQGPPY